VSQVFDYRYKPQGPTLEEYILSEQQRTMIMGPLGSGKTNASCWKGFRIMRGQRANAQKVRQTRVIAVRNTYPDLYSTTIKDWLDMFEPLGQFKQSGREPPTHYIEFLEEDGTRVEAEMVFLALDREEHVKKLRGLQATAAWVNEVKEVPKAILDMLDLRVGRYPKEVWPTWYGIFGDTNAPDTDHWYYRLAEEIRPSGWTFLRQPGGVVRETPQSPWVVNKGQFVPRIAGPAENVQNLPHGYYEKGIEGKSDPWILVNLANEYGYVSDGMPVHPDYIDSVHCKAFELVPQLPIHIGLDFGLTPAAIIGQRMLTGQWRWRYEVVTTDTGVQRFARELKRFLAEHCRGMTIASITGDPAGDQRQEGDEEERTVFQLLAGEGVIALPAPGNNDFALRTDAVNKPMTQLIDGAPGFLLHPECRVTRIGMQGGYKFRRLKVAGDERYENHPVKNKYSHPCEAGHYMHLGAGEGIALLRPDSKERQQEAAGYRAHRGLPAPGEARSTSAAAFRRKRGLQ